MMSSSYLLLLLKRSASSIPYNAHHQQQQRVIKNCFRLVTTNSGGGRSGDDEKYKKVRDVADPYGVDYLDGEDGLGPEDQLPPRYKRDPETGSMFDGQAVYKELTSHDKMLLNMTREEKVEIVQGRVEESFTSSFASNKKEKALVDRILNNEVGVSKAVRENHPDRKEWDKLKKKYYYLLKEKEKRKNERFFDKKNRNMTQAEKKYHELLDLHDLLPNDENNQEEAESTSNSTKDKTTKITLQDMEHPDRRPSNPWETENLAWVAQDVSLFSQGEMFMPPELSRAKKLNRRLATPIPKELIHHNNLDLIRRYVTPGGQIKNRIQTRIGAKDQRKIAKVVKRARAMGLIPYVGQWKIQDDGDLFDPTLDEKKDWEKVYEDAGLLGNNYKSDQPPTKEEKETMLRKARGLGLEVDAEGNIGLKEDMKFLANNLTMDPKALLQALMKKEDGRA